MSMMKKYSLFLGVLALAALPIFAQDATPVPTQDPAMMATMETMGTAEAMPMATMETMGTAEAMPMATMEMMGTMEAGMWPDTITVTKEGLFPEGVAYDPVNGRFFVSSVADGNVYAVDADGTLSVFIEDERIPSSLGLEVDVERNRLLVAATNQETEAYLGIYDLTTGENLQWVDLATATPNDVEHFANDVTVDSSGNAYVTDSLAGVIYQVDLAGNVSVWLEDEAFSTQFALNGLEYQPEGDYIIAVLVPQLIKIPIANPYSFNKVTIDTPIPGEDGLLILDERTVAVASNEQGSVYKLQSNDDFETAFIAGRFETGPMFPTTLALAEGEPYVLYAQLNAQEETRTDFPIQHVVFPGEPNAMATMEAAMPMATADAMSTMETMPMATMDMMATVEATQAP
jgi:DNA-binding beta-propeller fold protein YncE